VNYSFSKNKPETGDKLQMGFMSIRLAGSGIEGARVDV